MTGLIAALAGLWTDARGADFLAERAPAIPRLAPRAGFRADVRDFLVTRRDLAIGITVEPAILARRFRGTVANHVAAGQDPTNDAEGSLSVLVNRPNYPPFFRSRYSSLTGMR